MIPIYDFPVFTVFRKQFTAIFGQGFGGVQPGCTCFILWRYGVERKLEKKREAKARNTAKLKTMSFYGK